MDAYTQTDVTPDDAEETDELVGAYKKFAEGCGADAPKLLRHVSTVEAARDMDVLRAVLGDEKLTYVGASYGTFLGATYAGLFPDRTGRLVLDGAMDLSLPARRLNLEQTAGFETAFQVLREGLREAVRLPRRQGHHSPTRSSRHLKAFFDDLDAEPIPAGDADGRKLTESLATTGVIAAMYDEGAWQQLRESLTSAMKEKDGAGLLILSRQLLRVREADGGYSNLTFANAAVNCLDLPAAFSSPDEVRDALPEFEKASPVFGEGLAWASRNCTYWPVRPYGRAASHRGGRRHPDQRRGRPPPATPPPRSRWAEALADQLSLRAPAHLRGRRPHRVRPRQLMHLAGIFADTALLEGGSVVLRHDFDPGDVLATVERERITHTWLLPPLLYRLLDHPDVSDTDLSSLTRVSYGGTAAAPTRLRQAAELLGPVLYGLYGQAEAQLITETGPAEQELTGREGHPTVGRAVPGVEIVVQDTDGTVLAPGTPGEVLVRSPYAMHGYWKQPELTREVLRDGWVHTGDVGYLDEDGYLYIVDRIKEMIVVVGGHVYPAELEALLLHHPSVAQCTVFGSRDAESLEHVHAAVVPAPGHEPSLEEIRAFVTARKGRLYAPETLHLLPAIPLTTVGKPDRRRLRSLLTV
ncbi:2-succinylbenzoate--CoA ligase [Streptomyces tendae]